MLNWVNKEPSGNTTISEQLMNANVEGAFEVASRNANEFFRKDSVKRQQLLNLIIQVGIVKVIVALVQQIATSIRSAS